MKRALEQITFSMVLAGWLLTGVFGTWDATWFFWWGAVWFWVAALAGLATWRGSVAGAGWLCPASALLFTGYVVWRALTSDVPFLARRDLLFGGTAFIAYVLTVLRYDEPRQRHALMAVWLLLIGINFGYCLYQVAGHPAANPLSFLGFRRPVSDSLVGGVFPNSNHLAGFMELTGCMALAVAVCGRVHSFVRIVCGVFFGFAAVCVVLGGSRAGLAAFTGGVLLVLTCAALLRGSRMATRRGLRVGAVLAIGLALSVAAVVLVLKTYSGKSNEIGSLNTRRWLWTSAVEMWKDQPVTGHGARSFEYWERALRSLDNPWITWSDTDMDGIYAHNDWLQFLAEYGTAGALLLGLLLAAHLWRGAVFLLQDSAAARHGPRLFTDYRGAVVLGALGGIAALAAHSVFDFNMHIGINAVLAGAVLGLLARPGRPDPVVSHEEGPRGPAAGVVRGLSLTAAALLALFFCWRSVKWWPGDYQFVMARKAYQQSAGSLPELLRATADIKNATEADPDNPMAWFYRGLADFAAADELTAVSRQYWSSALERFVRASELYPQHPNAASYAAQMLDFLGRYEEAEPWHRKALQWGRGSRVVHGNYADHLLMMRRLDEALTRYQRLLHVYPVGGERRATIARKIEFIQQRQREAKEREAKRRAPAPVPPVVPPLPEK